MMLNAKPSELAAVVGVIDPDANSAATTTTGWIDMRDWGSLLAVIMAGVLGSSATLDAKFEQATSSGGAGAKDVTGKAITQRCRSVKRLYCGSTSGWCSARAMASFSMPRATMTEPTWPSAQRSDGRPLRQRRAYSRAASMSAS
jgi:hypothetical protein